MCIIAVARSPYILLLFIIIYNIFILSSRQSDQHRRLKALDSCITILTHLARLNLIYYNYYDIARRRRLKSRKIYVIVCTAK